MSFRVRSTEESHKSENLSLEVGLVSFPKGVLTAQALTCTSRPRKNCGVTEIHPQEPKGTAGRDSEGRKLARLQGFTKSTCLSPCMNQKPSGSPCSPMSVS